MKKITKLTIGAFMMAATIGIGGTAYAGLSQEVSKPVETALLGPCTPLCPPNCYVDEAGKIICETSK